MFINGHPLEDYNAMLIGSPKISPAQITQTTFMGKNTSSFLLLGTEIGLKQIECYIAFFGESAREIQLRRSHFRSALLGKVDLYFPFDGFHYFAVLQDDTQLESEHSHIVRSAFYFTGIQHDELIQTDGSSIYCCSTVPMTDCTISAVTTASEGAIGGMSFSGLNPEKQIVIDGMEKRILYDGAPGAQFFTFTSFPKLTPGINVIEVSNVKAVRLEYYPTYL